MARVREHFGGFAAGGPLVRRLTRAPEQTGGRRLVIRKEGTTAYFRAGFHAPAVAAPTFVPALLLDSVLTGAKSVNLWTAFRVPPPQRRARLYQAVVERGLASSLHGAMLPTAEPYLYTLSATQGTALEALDADSVTNVAEVNTAASALFTASNRTIGYVEPLAVGSSPASAAGTVEAQR